MDIKEHLKNLETIYYNLYNNNNLDSIKGKNHNCYGLNVLTLPLPKESDENVIYLQEDLLTCNEDLLFFTANLYLYLPYINNPVKEKARFGDNFYSIYEQNYYDRRYLIYTSVCFEKAYNFWCRFAEYLILFFPGEIKKKSGKFCQSN